MFIHLCLYPLVKFYTTTVGLAQMFVMVLLPTYTFYFVCTLPSILDNKLNGFIGNFKRHAAQ